MGWVLLSTLRNKRIAILAFCLAGFGLIALYVGLYPSLKAQFASYEELAKAFPEQLLKVMNYDASAVGTFEGYVAGENFGMVWPIMTLFFMIAFAGSAFTGEIERGQLGLTLAQPVSRSRVYWGKVLAALVGFAAYLLCSVVVIAPLALAFDITVSWQHVLTLTALCGLFGLAVYGVALAAACALSEKGRVYAIVTSLFVLMYVLNIVAALKPSFDNVKYGSFFHYLNASQAFVRSELPPHVLWLFPLVGVLGAVFAWWRFTRRDVAV